MPPAWLNVCGWAGGSCSTMCTALTCTWWPNDDRLGGSPATTVLGVTLDTSAMSSAWRRRRDEVRTAYKGACEAEQLGDAHHIHAKGSGAELAVLGEPPLLLCTRG